MKVGIGYDAHQLAKGETFIIGGIEIPYEHGSVGHSDGDVLIHAIIDSLLGAANLGDIGQLFPSSEKKWKDFNSLSLLDISNRRLISKGYEIVHIDSIVILQEPMISEFIPKMKNKISKILALELSQISIKATTTDHLGYIGESKGLAAQSISTIQNK
ncbi:2-C-methyl-D-erythritol 2,4-cyclodiphosphate synthase [Candidatus Marinimicrobia bacterium]|nr:2-C-methyl-D-erythritol 2,4-cyclodiphosphate synthase [Candidatus Neomarinimicrobiota bacterium]